MQFDLVDEDHFTACDDCGTVYWTDVADLCPSFQCSIARQPSFRNLVARLNQGAV